MKSKIDKDMIVTLLIAIGLLIVTTILLMNIGNKAMFDLVGLGCFVGMIIFAIWTIIKIIQIILKDQKEMKNE